MTMSEAHCAIDAVWRIEQAKLIAGLTRFTRDISQAEELAQEALLSALEQWPKAGIPDKPGAWLMTAAKNRAVDRIGEAQLGPRSHLSHFQRRLFGDRRRRLDAPATLRGSVAPGAHPGRPGASGSRSAWSRGAHGNPGLTHGGAHRPGWRTDPAARAKPRPLRPVAHQAWPCRTGARRGIDLIAWPLPSPGGDRRLPRAGQTGSRHELGAN